jgi:hypothetical protein
MRHVVALTNVLHPHLGRNVGNHVGTHDGAESRCIRRNRFNESAFQSSSVWGQSCRCGGRVGHAIICAFHSGRRSRFRPRERRVLLERNRGDSHLRSRRRHHLERGWFFDEPEPMDRRIAWDAKCRPPRTSVRRYCGPRCLSGHCVLARDRGPNMWRAQPGLSWVRRPECTQRKQGANWRTCSPHF